MGEVGAVPLRDTPNFPSTPPALVHLQEGHVGKRYGGSQEFRRVVPHMPQGSCHGQHGPRARLSGRSRKPNAGVRKRSLAPYPPPTPPHPLPTQTPVPLPQNGGVRVKSWPSRGGISGAIVAEHDLDWSFRFGPSSSSPQSPSAHSLRRGW
ncbi:hypothetical protein AOLI_G00015680 [Acnodon oligacanthus]